MKKIILYTIFLLTGPFLQAQSTAEFTVEVSSDSVLFGNFIEVKFMLKDANGGQFEAPSFEDFRVISGPNYASSFSMINSEVSQSASYTFQLEPKDIGNYYIGPASIRVEEEVLETKPLEILVEPNPDGIIENPRQGTQFQFEWGGSRWLQTPDTLQKKQQQLKLKKKKRKTYKI